MYSLPKEGICGHLITICLKRHKILGYPVFLSGDGYGRGMFVFNVSFVFDRDSELAAYEPLVRKTGRTLKALEVPLARCGPLPMSDPSVSRSLLSCYLLPRKGSECILS